MSEVVSSALLIIGGGFMLLAGIGVLRMPDLFMRMQAATKASTLGAGCMLAAVAVHFAEITVTTRALLVIAFIFVSAPVAAHVVARAAYSVGTPLWGGTIIDELRARPTDSGGTEPGQPSAGGERRAPTTAEDGPAP